MAFHTKPEPKQGMLNQDEAKQTKFSMKKQNKGFQTRENEPIYYETPKWGIIIKMKHSKPKESITKEKKA